MFQMEEVREVLAVVVNKCAAAASIGSRSAEAADTAFEVGHAVSYGGDGVSSSWLLPGLSGGQGHCHPMVKRISYTKTWKGE